MFPIERNIGEMNCVKLTRLKRRKKRKKEKKEMLIHHFPPTYQKCLMHYSEVMSTIFQIQAEILYII